MGESALSLWLTCGVLFATALLTGLLPLAFRGSPGGLEGPAVRMLSAGLMLGSGLGLVVPEGFFAFVQGAGNKERGLPQWLAGGALVAGFLAMLLLQLALEQAHGHVHRPEHSHGRGARLPDPGPAPGARHLPQRAGPAGYSALPTAEAKAGVQVEVVAVAQAAAAAASHGAAAAQLNRRGGGAGPGRLQAGLEDAEQGGAAGAGAGAEGQVQHTLADATSGQASPSLALGGLLVHSAADGLAVGAASLSASGPVLTLAVAGAILMHKLPVTAGLVAYLRSAGWPTARVVQGLLAFSASAPVAALATFYLLRAVLPRGDGGGDEATAGMQAVALAVLFSGGTFLAAATQHILPAALAGGGSARGLSGAPALALLAGGAALPLLIAALVPEAD